MAKQKKKRNKKYTGVDAATKRPSITRVSAVNRSRFGQWRHDHQRQLSIARTVVIIIVALIIIVSGVMSLF